LQIGRRKGRLEWSHHGEGEGVWAGISKPGSKKKEEKTTRRNVNYKNSEISRENLQNIFKMKE
jgi:hypothetical protein